MNDLKSALSADSLRAMIDSGLCDTLAWFDPLALDDLSGTLAAMANTRGGHVLIGVTGAEVAQMVGVVDAAKTVDAVLTAALTLEPPLITPLPFTVTLDDKTVVVIEVPAGMPYIYMSDGRYLTRADSRNTPLRPKDLHQLMIARGEISFETEPVQGVTLDDLDWDKVKDYARSLRVNESDAQSLLYKRGCLIRQGDKYYPTNAGILLFGKDPTPYIRGAEITAVRFAGETMSDTFSRQDIGGTLPDQIRRAETFLIDHLRKGIKLKGTMARQEQFEYPMEAAREVVVNAVAHRDYSIQGDGIRLLLFKDRMEVNSPGTLPGPVTVANIKDERFSRNPAIVQVLADMGFIERLGYGIDRIMDLMDQNGLRAPEFSETSGGFRVNLYNALNEEASNNKQPKVDAEIVLPEAYAGMSLNPRQEMTLVYLNQSGNTRITNSELQRMFPDVHAETIRRDLADLVGKDVLEKMGQKRGSYYVLKKSAG